MRQLVFATSLIISTVLLAACQNSARKVTAADAEVDVLPDSGAHSSGRDVADASAPSRTPVPASQPDASSPDGGVRLGADAGRPVSSSAPDAGSRQDAPWVIQNGASVFFVGNSFFNWQDRWLPEWVEAVGEAVQPPIAIRTGQHIVPGNRPLSWFFEQDDSQKAIDSGEYDIFIIQGEEFEPVRNKAAFHQAVRAYHDAVQAHGGQVMLFMTWNFKWDDGSSFLQDLVGSYEEIGSALDIPVIPVGLIYADTNKDPFPGKEPYWLTASDLHQTVEGSAVNAYATFMMLTGINPMGAPFMARNNTNSPEMLRYLSQKSWARVAERLSP